MALLRMIITVCSHKRILYWLTVGIRLAKLTTLPETILTRATEISETLTARARQRTRNSNTHIFAQRRQLILQLQETLRQAARGNMEDESLARWLRRVQNRFVEEFGVIE